MSSAGRPLRRPGARRRCCSTAALLSACDDGQDIRRRPARPTTPRRPAVLVRSATTRAPTRRGSIRSQRQARRKRRPGRHRCCGSRATHGRLSTVDGDRLRRRRRPAPARSPATAARGRPSDRLEPGTTYTVEASVARRRRRAGHPALAVQHPGPHPRPADLPLRGAAARRDRRRRHAGDRQLRRPGHRPGRDREAHDASPPTPEQPGTWYWLSDNEVHYRPKKYWKAGTKVDVDVDVNSVPAGNGIYGQEDRAGRLPGRRRPHLQGRHEHPPDEGVLQRQAAAHPPDHHRRAAEVHHPLRASR